MARNMYTIHAVTLLFHARWGSRKYYLTSNVNKINMVTLPSGPLKTTKKRKIEKKIDNFWQIKASEGKTAWSSDSKTD